MLLKFDHRATVRTAVAAGDYTTVVKTGLVCRLCRPGIQTEPANDDRPDATVRHFLLYDPAFLMPAAAQIEVDGERWNVVEGSDDLSPGLGRGANHRRCELVRGG